MPTSGPVINGEEKQYQIGDFLSLNCTSGKSSPKSILTWYINDEQVSFYSTSPCINFRTWEKSICGSLLSLWVRQRWSNEMFSLFTSSCDLSTRDIDSDNLSLFFKTHLMYNFTNFTFDEYLETNNYFITLSFALFSRPRSFGRHAITNFLLQHKSCLIMEKASKIDFSLFLLLIGSLSSSSLFADSLLIIIMYSKAWNMRFLASFDKNFFHSISTASFSSSLIIFMVFYFWKWQKGNSLALSPILSIFSTGFWVI